MASFTDSSIQFAPYVSQIPNDLMLKVGMDKQQKYEQGIQKIQSNIDNVAGLDIANPAQQKYLESKLNQLGNDLKWVGASDFSDFQLVNSVNGMTNQITKDKYVLNAVSSTSRVRAGYKKREELSKKGLTDKNNDDYYDKDVQAYICNEDVKASFNSDYVPFTNIVKKLQDALVNVGESSTVAEQLFVTGNDGKPLLDKTGHYQYADVKTINKLVTNKPAVLAAINNVMNEGSVKQQLGIDGWATYKNTEATSLLEPLQSQYINQKVKLQQDAVNITALSIGTNLSQEQKDAYKKANSNIEASILENDKTFSSLLDQAQNSPEEFKQNFYTQEFKQRLMTQFSKEEVSETTGVNEGLQQQNWRDTQAFNALQEKNKIAYQNETLKISQSGDKRAWLEFYAGHEQDPVTGDWNKKPEQPKLPKPGAMNPNTPLFKGSTSGEKVSAINIMQTDINDLTEGKGKVAFTMYADLIRATNNNYKLTDQEILRTATVYAKNAGVTREAYLDRWAKNIVNKYDEAGIKPPPNLGDQLNDFLTTSKSLNNKMAMVKSAEIAADKEAGVNWNEMDMVKSAEIAADKEAGVNWNEMDKVLSKGPTLNYNIEGSKYTLTPKDLLLIHHGMLTAVQVGGLDTSNLPTNLKKVMDNWDNLPEQVRRQVVMESNKYTDLRNHNGQKLSKANELFNQKLSKIVGVTDAVTGSLPMGDADQIKTSVSNVASYVTGGERSFGKGTTKENILTALDNPTSITWSGKKPTNAKEDWTGSIHVTAKDGSVYTINDINHEELQQFTNLNLLNYEEKPIQDLLNLNENTKSTNPIYGPSSTKAWTTSYFKDNEVNAEVTKAGWGYRADVVKSGGGYRLVNYVKPPGSNKYTTIYGNSIAPNEHVMDIIFKTTSPKELEGLYFTYLQNQNK